MMQDKHVNGIVIGFMVFSINSIQSPPKIGPFVQDTMLLRVNDAMA